MSKETLPQYSARDVVFYSRSEEQKHLLHHLNMSSHVVLLAPEKYGKSSLVRQVAEQWASEKHRKAAIRINFLTAWNIASAGELIIKGAGDALNKMLPDLPTEDLMKLAGSLQGRGLSLVIGMDGLKLSFLDRIRGTEETVCSISTILNKIDEIAMEHKWKIMFEMSEFQEIFRVPKGHAVEAEIRSAVQHTQNISCVFLGSNSQMLEAMVNDKSRPFYKMCHIMRLKRINSEIFHQYIESAAVEKWSSNLTVATIDQILTVTEKHPYYINKLCSKLWSMEHVPSEEDVKECWETLVDDEGSKIVPVIISLSLSQKAIMNHLAFKPEAQMASKKALDEIGVASSTMRTARTQLQKDGVIYRDESDGPWRVMNPCLSAYLRKTIR